MEPETENIGEPITETIDESPRKRKKEAKHGTAGTRWSERYPAGRSPNKAVKTDYHEKDLRIKLAQWLSFKATHPGISTKEIAEKIGCTVANLYQVISRARRQGLLKLDDPMEQLRHQIIPKAVDNLEALLDAKDKTATLETVKGTVFKVYQAQEGVMESQQSVLAIKIDMGSIPTEPQVVTGQIVGRPRELKAVDGDVSNEQA